MISIITPVYNKELYLKKCIESVLLQSYTNWELILIDDGSTDESADICKYYEKKDSRIHFFSQVNAGPGCARNNGLDHASGEYVVFLDADDYLLTDYLETLVQYYQYDFVVSGYTRVYATESDDILEIPQYKLLLNKENIKQTLFRKDNFKFFVGPVSKMYNSKIIKKHGIRYMNINYGEDIIFNFSYLKYCHKIAILSYSGYQNRIIDGTLSRKHVDSMQIITKQIEKSAKEAFNIDKDESLCFLIVRNIKLILINELDSYIEFKGACRMIADNKLKKIKLGNLDIKDKIIIISLRMKCYRCVYAILSKLSE